ncbi:MAG: hypothetical protein II685_02065 [Clostridia bacterium]|nr:hypothetical protein [Clostridia bacterium]
MELIYTAPSGEELGVLTDFDLDLEVGDTNDFLCKLSLKNNVLETGSMIYENDSEYGGIITSIDVDTRADTIAYGGQTWRGLLDLHVIEPPDGESYKTVSGSVSDIIEDLLEDLGLDGFFAVETSEITVSSYQFDRYVTLGKGIEKMLKSKGQRLSVICTNGAVTLKVEPIHDLSDTIEYSEDQNVGFRIKQDEGTPNHLICLGSGELSERQVIHLYVQEDGTIGSNQFYFGLDERAETYDYPNVESLEELEKSGRERFADLRRQDSYEMTIENIQIELGDIIGGRERVTGIEMKAPITRKIITATDSDTKINYKVG